MLCAAFWLSACSFPALNLVGKTCSVSDDCGDLICLAGTCALTGNIDPVEDDAGNTGGGADSGIVDAGAVLDGGVLDGGPDIDGGPIPDGGPVDGGVPVLNPLPRPLDATWTFIEGSEAPPANWNTLGFDDSEWRTGSAPLGYGDDDVATQVSFGPDGQNKYISSYFRQVFGAEQVPAEDHIWVTYRRDDGVVFYLNGTEIGRDNLPEGPITPDTLALESTNDAVEDTFFTLSFPSSALIPGDNVLAVELHQFSPTSSDIFFQASLEFNADPYEEPAIADCGVYAAPDYEVCNALENQCDVLFQVGQGCTETCALAGLVCLEAWQNLAGECAEDVALPVACEDDTGNQSDFCRCVLP